MTLRFLLIPDLHFGAPGDDRAPQVSGAQESDWLIEALLQGSPAERRRPGRKESPYLDDTSSIVPHVIVATGDLTNKAGKNGFAAARAFLSTLKRRFPQASLFVTPGNHDVAVSHPNSRERKPFYPTVQTEEAFQGLRDATAGLVTPPDVVNPDDPYSFLHVVHVDDRSPSVCLMGLNSSRLERPACLGLGYVGLDQFSRLLLDGLKNPLRKHLRKPVFGLAVTHFSPLPAASSCRSEFHEDFPELYRRIQQCSLSFLTDSAQVLGALADARFAVLAHGHSHQNPCARRISGYSLGTLDGETGASGREESLRVIDGGLFVPGENRRHFVVLEFEPYGDNWGHRAPKHAIMRAHAFQYDVGDRVRVGPRQLRQENLPLEPINLEPLMETGASGTNLRHTLTWKTNRAREFAACCRAWGRFYSAREHGGGGWETELQAIEDFLTINRVSADRREIEAFCSQLDPYAPPPAEQLEALPAEFIGQKVRFSQGTRAATL